MCGSSPPKPKAPPAPPPPPAPAAEAPASPVYDADLRSRDSERSGASRRRLGRSALRIDLQAPSRGGLQVPDK
ncbi:MAG: hypothetical protein AAGM38_13410 [Pseudomonadota bacterium]